jgi:hypothetical protein
VEKVELRSIRGRWEETSKCGSLKAKEERASRNKLGTPFSQRSPFLFQCLVIM